MTRTKSATFFSTVIYIKVILISIFCRVLNNCNICKVEETTNSLESFNYLAIEAPWKLTRFKLTGD